MLFRVMNPHQRCLQAKVKYRNEQKQVMPRSEDLNWSPINKSCNHPGYIFQHITHVHFYEIKKDMSMLIKMHLITLFRVMNPHQRCLQAKVKYRNEPKQVMPKSEDLNRSPINKSCTLCYVQVCN